MALTIELDDDLAQVLRAVQEPAAAAARELIVMELYRRHAISLGKAAQLLGMPLLAFIQYSGKLGIPYFDYSDEDWEYELRTIRER